MAIMDAYASVFNVLAEKDRNHLREIFASVLPTILERAFEHSAMLNVVNFLISQQTNKIVIEALLLFSLRDAGLGGRFSR